MNGTRALKKVPLFQCLCNTVTKTDGFHFSVICNKYLALSLVYCEAISKKKITSFVHFTDWKSVTAQTGRLSCVHYARKNWAVGHGI